jgi:Ca-activated chloride channel family protein
VRIGVRSRDTVDGVPEALEDVTIRVEFNPAEVASHRLLGSEIEGRSLAVRDFHTGEAGAPRSVTALYEITLAGAEAGDPAGRQELLTVKLRWKRPDAEESTGIEVPLADRGREFAEAPADLRFAAAVAAFGMILQGSDQRGEATLPLVAKIAADAIGRDERGHRAEFLDLVRRAESAR